LQKATVVVANSRRDRDLRGHRALTLVLMFLFRALDKGIGTTGFGGG
jgi:hypothetical protein